MNGRSFLESNFNGSTYIPSSGIQSIPGFFPRDGDLSIAFLSGNNIRFQEPVNDLWYRATSPTHGVALLNESGGSSALPAYRPDEAASPMACLAQFQFCDATTIRCGPLSSWADAQTEAGKLFGTTLDAENPPLDKDPASSRFYWFVALMSYSVPELQSILHRLGASSLASTRNLYNGVMGPLRDDQWQVDVMQWWATYLAGVQAGVVSTAAGPSDSSVEHLRIKPYNKWIQEHICNNQVSLLFVFFV